MILWTMQDFNKRGHNYFIYCVIPKGRPGGLLAAYDYRSFGEQVTLTESADKVTENFTGKEKDDETQLDYF